VLLEKEKKFTSIKRSLLQSPEREFKKVSKQKRNLGKKASCTTDRVKKTRRSCTLAFHPDDKTAKSLRDLAQKEKGKRNLCQYSPLGAKPPLSGPGTPYGDS